MGNNCFKTCPNCGDTWSTQKDFLMDEMLDLNGYKADFEKLEYGMFFFTHKKDGCYSTMVIEVSDFMNLFQGKIYTERKTGGPDCLGFCLDEEQMDRCDAICECAFVRELLYKIKNKTF